MVTFQFLIVANDSNFPQKRGRHIGVRFFQGRVSEPRAMYNINIGCAIVTWFTHAVPAETYEAAIFILHTL